MNPALKTFNIQFLWKLELKKIVSFFRLYHYFIRIRTTTPNKTSFFIYPSGYLIPVFEDISPSLIL